MDTSQPTARLLDCTTAQYFKDPCAVPSLSQSTAFTLLNSSPLHAWTQHPRFGNVRRASTAAMSEGTAIHRLLLNKGADFEVIEADSFRTKLAQEQRDRALEEHRLPVLRHQHDEWVTAADRIKVNLAALNIHLTGESEVPIEWQESGSLGPVTCRGMFDHVIIDRGIIYDIKKADSASPKKCGRSVVNYGYSLQHAAYTSALAKLKPEFEGAVDFIFVFVEVDPPYAVLPARLDGMLRELGAMQWNRAVRLWEHCLTTNNWPSYTNQITTLEAPPWAITEEMGVQS